MTVKRDRIAQMLRDRGRPERAEFVERNLPDDVDVRKSAALLRMLHTDLGKLVDDTVNAPESV